MVLGRSIYPFICTKETFNTFQVLDKCIRVYHFPKTFPDARDKCKSEGSDLADIPNENFQNEFRIFMSLMANASQLYSQVQELWFGGVASDSGDWKWIGNSQSFNGFTTWKNNARKCNQSVCRSMDALVVNVVDKFQWSGKNFTNTLPYVCMKTCSIGYSWSEYLQKCLMISSKEM